MVRIAMVSFAHVHAQGYARQVQEHPDAEIACVWDDDVQRGQSAAQQNGAPFCRDLQAVLSDPKVDAVVINAETSKHADIILQAVSADKHIFSEKALTVTTADAGRVVKAVRASRIHFMISLPSRTRPDVLFAKRMLDEGALGQVTFMRARVAHSAALDGWFAGGSLWFGDPGLAGGGALFDLGCHTVDVMRWFLGEPKSVTAQIQNFSDRYPIDDNAAVAVEFKNGALGVLDVSWVHRAGPNLMEIYGTEGYLIRGLPGAAVRMASRKLEAAGVRGAFEPTDLGPGLPGPMQQWISAIEKGTPMTITVEDGRNLTELLEAAYISAREGRRMEFSAD